MGKKHALIVPVFMQAHFFGMYRFALEIAKRGVTVSFAVSEKLITIVRTFDEWQGLDFKLIAYQDFENADSAPREDLLWDVGHELATARSRFQPVLDKLVADRKGGISGPTCIIGDRNFTWVKEAAKELNIPFYMFWSAGAIYIRGVQAYASLIADGSLIIKRKPGGAEYLEKFEGYLNIPGLPPLEYRDMLKPPPGSLVDYVEVGRNANEADVVIVNTFYEFESPVIDAIHQVWKDVCPAKIPKLFLVGPVSNAANFKDRSLQVPDQKGGTAPLQWLDGRPPLSVVYICVGSVADFSPDQVEELAEALEASEQNFLWVAARGAAEAISPNFEARTRERGLVVSGWVPQLQILQHPAVGGFLTHCGWNSILESISSGVPMACWPLMTNDQLLNRRYLVDVLKVALEVRSTTPNSPGTQVGLEKAVRLLVSDEGSVLRARLQELKKKAAATVADGGNSKKALDDLVESIPS